jgi:hypothetical protein
MIEFGGTGFRFVTLPTILTEFSLMLVVFLMTVETSAFPNLVVAAHVTGHTSDGLVFPFEQELTMIKVLTSRSVEMQSRRMTLFAIGPKCSFVFVFVTSHTLEFPGSVNTPRVTANTIALQRFFTVKTGEREP